MCHDQVYAITSKPAGDDRYYSQQDSEPFVLKLECQLRCPEDHRSEKQRSEHSVDAVMHLEASPQRHILVRHESLPYGHDQDRSEEEHESFKPMLVILEVKHYRSDRHYYY